MDQSVAGSPFPAAPVDREPPGDVQPIVPEPTAIDPAAATAPPADDEADIERQIEALKTFLARYPPAPPAPEKPAADLPPPAAPDPIALSPEPSRGDDEGRTTVDRRLWIAAGVTVAVIIAALALTALPFRSGTSEAPHGSLSVTTNPSGLTVVIDGSRRATTPLTVNLAPGDHVLELVTSSETRRIPVTIVAGSQVSHFFELAPIALSLAETPANRPVPAVATTGAIAPNAAGWVSVTAPADVQVLEGGRLLGSSRIERMMLPVGRHELEFVNETLGYRSVQTVHVSAGELSTVRLRWPQGTVALNAVPWAEVWIDGQQVGETPIGSLSLPIGVHEVVFRHPELGERRASLTVTLGKQTTLGIDLGAK